MLIRLRGKNFRSFKDEFELSLVAADLPSDGDRGIAELPVHDLGNPLRVLRVAALYGPNASGKSTVLQAAAALRWLVVGSYATALDDPLEYYQPFRLDNATSSAPVELACTFWFEKRLYEYEIKYSESLVEFESLYRLDDPDHPLITRAVTDDSVSGSLVAGSDQVQALLGQLKPNASVVSYLAQLGPKTGESSIVPEFRALVARLDFENFQDPGLSLSRHMRYDFNAHRMHAEPEYKEWVLDHLIRPADLGIDAINTEVIEPGGKSVRKVRNRDGEYVEMRRTRPDRVRVEFEHAGLVPKKFGLSQESAGTQKMYALARQWWELAEGESTLFADELSASLHPALLDRLVRAVNLPSSDARHSQLILATHDTSLLESRSEPFPALRRDQVYFTEKAGDGSSRLYSLAEFRERSEHNIRKRYLSNRYGAMPRISDLPF